MRWLADENFPAPVIAQLRASGHDILSIAQTMPGVTDEQVLTTAIRESRILLTLDNDYGAMIFHKRLPAPPGVVLFRLTTETTDEANRRTLSILSGPDVFTGWFTTVTDQLTRSRPFPR